MPLNYEVEKASPENTADFGKRSGAATMEILDVLNDMGDDQVVTVEIPEDADPKKFKQKIKTVAKDRLERYVDVVQIPGGKMRIRWGASPPPRPAGAKPPGRPKAAS